MSDIIGVRFKRAGKVYYFDPAGIEIQSNDYVVVETTCGAQLGQVVIAPKQVVASEIETPLKPLLRKATDEDIAHANEFEMKEREALAECGRLIGKLGLPMKLLSAQYSLDGKRLTFYFRAAERVDFRELVRELAGSLKLRVELRQLGPRDEAKMIGGCGRCGRPLCCESFLVEFSPVSIRMAKEQGLPLNPMKISGCCGRLMCCLVYENELYHTAKEKMPREGRHVRTPQGVGKVIGSSVLKETVLVELENEVTVEVPLKDVSVLEDSSPRKQQGAPESTPEVAKAELQGDAGE